MVAEWGAGGLGGRDQKDFGRENGADTARSRDQTPIGGAPAHHFAANYRVWIVGHDERQPSPAVPHPRRPMTLGVLGAVALDAIALGASVTLVAAGAGALDRGLAGGVLVAAATAFLIGSVAVTPSGRPGTTGRLLDRELVVVALALASFPIALGLSLHDGVEASMVALASVVVVALGLRMALLTWRADLFGRAQADHVAQLGRMALHDPLTGLPNRTLLEDRLAMAVAGQRRSGTVLAVLFCDLDRFKVVNDTLGHETGDAVLVVMAERLNGAVRSTDTVSRLGGDEFVVVCPDLKGEEELVDVVERLLVLMSEPMEVAGHEIVVSGSVGVSLVRAGSAPSSLADLVREADAAMYRAKANGRNGWARLEPEPPEPRYARVRGDDADGTQTLTPSQARADG
jgi:diguanylate cyclase (GGDEF)-like protein